MARDAARLQRERKVEEILVEYFLNTARTEEIRQQAQAKAAKVLADAEDASREPAYVARLAVRALAELGETRGSIVELTGLSAAAVRDMLNDGDGAPQHAVADQL